MVLFSAPFCDLVGAMEFDVLIAANNKTFIEFLYEKVILFEKVQQT